MALTIKKIPMPADKYQIKCPYAMTPTRIVIHNTENDASAKNEIEYMQKNDLQVSFHYAVDDKEAVQGVDLWRNAWHAGDGGSEKSLGNRQGIAIEICYSRSGGERFEKAEKNAAELAAKLLIDFGWGIDRITKHQDYSGKYCPRRTLNMGWDRFVKMVAAKRDEMLKKNKPSANLSNVTMNGYKIEKAKDFSILYWDKSKKKGKAQTYINGGFFGNYKEGVTPFTLPVGNLVADVTQDSSLKYVAEKHWKPYVSGGKFRYNTSDNPVYSTVRGRKISTLIVPKVGAAYIDEVSEVSADARYAISGIPVIRKGVDVSYSNFVRPQGWDESPFYATSRNFIGLKGSDIYIVSGASKTSNFVASSEVFNALKDFGFEDLIALDGGGSYYRKFEGKADVVWKDRDVNNLVIF